MNDGQAYLYWGNPNCYYVKLNKDMISYKGEIHAVPMKPEAFGRREGDPQRPTCMKRLRGCINVRECITSFMLEDRFLNI